ncbi:MAG: EAL domain-containing protein [Methylovulum sp.]|nr:EAL domain-containing protein [Methylovulum sp.]
MIFPINKFYSRFSGSLLRPWLISALVLCGGCGVTVSLWRDAQQQMTKDLQTGLGVVVDQIAHNIVNRIVAYEVVMRGVKGYFEGSRLITRTEFRTYIQDLQIQEKTPGIQGIGLVLVVPEADKSKHERAIRKQGFPDYRIMPEGKRDRYAPIVFMEPSEENTKALGYDILTVPEAAVALERSAETGEVAVTDHFTLIQDLGKPDSIGFVMYLPIYRNGIKPDKKTDQSTTITGWVDVPFRINDLMAGLRGEFDPDVLIEIHDGEPKLGKTRLYRSDGQLNQDILRSSGLKTHRQIMVGDHPWTLLMATTPAFEARVPSKDKAVWVAITGCTITLLLSVLVWLQASQRNRAHRYFRQLFDLDGDGVLILDADLTLVNANPAVLNMLGYSADELLKLRLPDLLAKKERQRLEPAISWLMSVPRHRGEWLHVRKNGSEFPVEIRAHRIDGKRFIAVLHDLTEQKKACQRIQRLTDLYQALSETNQAIVHMGNETDLFSMVCQNAVQYGGMTMAWIGKLEESSALILPISAYGTGVDYLDGLIISSNGAVPEGCGLAGTALRENRAIIANDYFTTSLTRPWHAQVKRFGWGSAAAFPIQRNASPFAVFNLYHTETDAFDADAIRLLTEMADDMSFALDNRDHEVQRLASEAALRSKEQMLSDSQRIARIGSWRIDLRSNKIIWSDETYRLHQITPDSFDHTFEAFLKLIHPEDRQIVQIQIKRWGEGKDASALEFRILLPDGSVRVLEAQGELRYGASSDKQAVSIEGTIQDITERKQTETTLREGEERYHLLFDANPVPMWVYDLDTLAFLAVNSAAIRHYGYTLEAFLSMTLTDLWPAADVSGLQAGMLTIDFFNHTVVLKHRRKDASLIWVEISRHPLNFEGRAAEIMLAYDVTSRIAAEQQLRLNAQVFESSREGILITDANNKIVAVNPAYCEMSGYKAEEIMGNNPNFISTKRHDELFYKAMWSDILNSGYWRGEVTNCRKNGDIFPQRLSISVVRDQNGQIVHHIAIMSDLTEQKATDELIQFLSNFDPLTKLPNRTLLRDRTELAISGSLRADGGLALIYIDLDRFNIINDSLGSDNGDHLLKELSVRLASQLRPDDTLCRQGGDEFILLLPDADLEGTAHVAKKVLEIVAQPFIIANQRVSLTASVGIALFPQDGANFEQLTQAADAALFRAKQNGRNNFQFFTRQLHEQVSLKLQIESELRLALEQGQLLLYYQPQVDAKTLKIIGAEALIRWLHPQKGMVPPGQFIPIAEESGLIIEIGDWVLQTAIRQLTAWQSAGLAIVPVAVNLSVTQFRHDALYDKVAQLLCESKLDPAMLELEITEGIAMENSMRMIGLLNKLRSLGISLSIDDFGTGYSSLSYLKRFKIDKLKVDQSFVDALGNSPGDEAIVTAIISLAKSLGFKTIAEGVETQTQLDFLLERQCDEIQGYYFCKPVPADAFADMLRNGGGWNC